MSLWLDSAMILPFCKLFYGMKRILVTGSGGLVGSEVVRHFSKISDEILGIDNDSRGRWFGNYGSVQKSINDLKYFNYKHLSIDIKNNDIINDLIQSYQPTAIIHCAGQPSHEKSAEIPYEDFQVNTVGTVNLLEAMRQFVPNCSFIFTSTNKVYGDNPNRLPILEFENRYLAPLVDESMSIDNCLHSPFGSNKAAADLIVQEYGKYYNLNTVCFRCGCITGGNHKGVEQHGFLSYLCKVAKSKEIYTIYGYNGKQVRDNIHAADLVSAFYAYLLNPSCGAVYNIGGGLSNSCSVLEAIKIIEEITGFAVKTKFGESRKGDHICYMTNNKLFQSHYPSWKITRLLPQIFQEILTS